MRQLIAPSILLLLSAGAAQAQQGVGIGTTSPHPRAALDISSADKGLLVPRLTSTQRHAISAPPAGLMVFQTGPDSVGFWYATGTGAQWLFLPDQARAADNLGNHTATGNLKMAGRWISADGDAEGLKVDSTGNVGIGTPTPTARLSISPTAVEPKITLWNAFNAADHYGFGVTGFQLNYHVATLSDNHVFYATGLNGNGTELLRIRGNGRVGIGASNPVGKLHLITDNSNGGGDDDYVFDTYGNSADEGIFLRKSRGTFATPANLQAGDRIGTLSFVPRINNTGLQYFTGSQIQSYYLGDGTTTLSDLRFYTSGQVERLRINQLGRVGVGTGNPRKKLHVYSTQQHDGIRLQAAPGVGAFGSASLEFWSDPAGNPSEWRPAMMRATDNGAFTGGLAFYVNGSGFSHRTDSIEVMRVTNRRVGIGTPNPFTALHVHDTTSVNLLAAYFEGNHADYAGAYVNALKASAAPYWGYRRQGGIVGWHEVSTDGDWRLALRTGVSSNMFAPLTVSDTVGYVGLLTSGPRTRLSISPTSAEPKITLWDGGSETSHYGFGATGAQLNYHVNAPAGSHVFYAGGKNGDGTELLRILGSGVVRIPGLAGASTRMVTADASGNLGFAPVPAAETTTASNGLTLDGTAVQLGGTLSEATTIATAGHNLSLTGTGRLGVGTSPLFRLHVADATSITVAQFDGGGPTFAGTYTNATAVGSQPFYGYKQQGTIRAFHYVDPSGDWVLSVANSDRLMVDGSTGNVGIGTVPSSARLDVSTAAASAIDASSSSSGATGTVSISNTAGNVALAVTAGVVTLSSTLVTAPTANGSVTPTTTLLTYTNNSTIAANGTITLNAGREGQLLIVTNSDPQSITVGGVALASGDSRQFVYTNSSWRVLN